MYSRRQFLRQVTAGLALAPTLTARGNTAAPRCAPVISGNLWWYHPDSYTMAQWKQLLLDQQQLGFDLLWLSNVTSALDTEAHQDALRALMDLAAAMNFQVILDTGSTPNWFGHRDIVREMEHCGKTISMLGEEFGKHHAFFGWYIPHEIYMAWDDFADYIDALFPALVKACKRAAEKPVLISPFFILDRDTIFGKFRYNEPEAYRDYWAALLTRSGIDIVMLQDSGEHFSYVTNAMRRPFFEAMHQACAEANATLWGNVECAEFICESPEAYVETYGRVHHAAVNEAPWRAVPIDRMKQKLSLASEFSERIVTWGYQQYGLKTLGNDAQAWNRDYAAYYQALAKT